MGNMQNIKPLLMFVSILSFIVSLVFTIQLLSSQATTESDKALFSGLAISAEFGKIILFSIGMMLLFVVKNKSYSWIGVPLLLVSLSFTILSVVGTLGALYTRNAEKTEASIISSDKYNLLKSQIQSLEEQTKQLRSTAAGQPSTWKTHNDAIQSAQKAEEKKAELLRELQSIETAGTGAQNALYVALSNWTGDSIETVKFKVMASYGIGLEALALFCALFAFFGDYLLGDKKKKKYADETEVEYDEIYDEDAFYRNYEALTGENERLRNEIEFYRQLEAKKKQTRPKEAEPNEDYVEREAGFTAKIKARPNLPTIKDYIDAAFENIEKEGKDHLTGRSKIAKKLQIGKGKANKYHNYLKQMNLVEVQGSKTYPLLPKEEMISLIQERVGD